MKILVSQEKHVFRQQLKNYFKNLNQFVYEYNVDDHFRL